MRNHDKDAMDELDELDALFSEARGAPVPVPSAELLARIAADAEAVLSEPVAVDAVGWRAWVEALGGWPAMGGLVTAGVAGLWIGAMPATGVSDVLSGLFGESVSIGVIATDDFFGLEAEG